MIFRRIKAHIEKENWFAVFIDFLIVVIGVFIGIQVANWNDNRAIFENETQALVELKKELEASIDLTHAKITAYQQAIDAGKRSLTFIDSHKECAVDCWDILVDFMHASQWQDLHMSRSKYQNMRNAGFPKSIVIVDALEAYTAQNKNNTDAVAERPVYRSLVRQLINVKAQEFYWEHCWSFVDGIEKYILDCPKGLTPKEAKLIVELIVNNSNLKPHLTEWIGNISLLPITLGDQNIYAQRAIDLVYQELENR